MNRFDMGPYPFLAGSLTDKVPTFMGCPYTIPNVKGSRKRFLQTTAIR